MVHDNFLVRIELFRSDQHRVRSCAPPPRSSMWTSTPSTVPKVDTHIARRDTPNRLIPAEPADPNLLPPALKPFAAVPPFRPAPTQRLAKPRSMVSTRLR